MFNVERPSFDIIGKGYIMQVQTGKNLDLLEFDGLQKELRC